MTDRLNELEKVNVVRCVDRKRKSSMLVETKNDKQKRGKQKQGETIDKKEKVN